MADFNSANFFWDGKLPLQNLFGGQYTTAAFIVKCFSPHSLAKKWKKHYLLITLNVMPV
jgi:hypothetical protein